MAKIIVVFGATGQQGGAVARVLKEDGQFQVRAVSRTIEGVSGEPLRQVGIETVNANYDDTASLNRVLEGAYGCFVVTVQNKTTSVQDIYEDELRQGKNISDACKNANVRHVVFSTICLKDLVFGASKVAIQEYMDGINLPVSGVFMSWYFENLLQWMKAKKLSKNCFGFGWPMDKTQWASLDDLGKFVSEVFQRRDAYIGKTVQVIAEDLDFDDICFCLNKHLTPTNFKDIKVSREEFKEALPVDMPECVKNDYVMLMKTKIRNTDFEVSDATKMKTFDDWVLENKERLRSAYPLE